MNKDFAQKAYEKLEMARRNPEKLKLMIANDEAGGGHIILVVDWNPIAVILQEPNDLTPDHDMTKLLTPMFDKAAEVDQRKTPEEFNEDNLQVTKIIDTYLTGVGI